MINRCIECGGLFEATRSNNTVCSDDCRRARNRKKIAKWQADHPDEEKKRKRRQYAEYKKKKIVAPVKKAKRTLDESIAECRALGYGPNYGQYMIDKHFGRI